MGIDLLKKNIGDFIRVWMEGMNLNQKNAALELGIDQGRLSRYIQEKEMPKIDLLARLAELAGVKVDDIISFNINRERIMNKIKIIGNSNNIAGGDINININRSQKRRVEYIPQADDISPAQASKLKEIVNQIVEVERRVSLKPKSHAAVWSVFNKAMKVTYYREIKKDDYIKAETYLMRWKGRLQNNRIYKENEPEEAKKNIYKTIFSIAKKELNMTKKDIDDFIKGSFGADSIKDLTQEELEKLVRRFRSKKQF